MLEEKLMECREGQRKGVGQETRFAQTRLEVQIDGPVEMVSRQPGLRLLELGGEKAGK